MFVVEENRGLPSEITRLVGAVSWCRAKARSSWSRCRRFGDGRSGATHTDSDGIHIGVETGNIEPE